MTSFTLCRYSKYLRTRSLWSREHSATVPRWQDFPVDVDQVWGVFPFRIIHNISCMTKKKNHPTIHFLQRRDTLSVAAMNFLVKVCSLFMTRALALCTYHMTSLLRPWLQRSHLLPTNQGSLTKMGDAQTTWPIFFLPLTKESGVWRGGEISSYLPLDPGTVFFRNAAVFTGNKWLKGPELPAPRSSPTRQRRPSTRLAPLPRHSRGEAWRDAGGVCRSERERRRPTVLLLTFQSPWPESPPEAALCPWREGNHLEDWKDFRAFTCYFQGWQEDEMVVVAWINFLLKKSLRTCSLLRLIFHRDSLW